MIRSSFQYSFVIQSVLHSYLVGFVLLALQLQSSSTMLLQCLCTESEVCMRTGYELYELLFHDELECLILALFSLCRVIVVGARQLLSLHQ